jgi:hypothetical protein
MENNDSNTYQFFANLFLPRPEAELSDSEVKQLRELEPHLRALEESKRLLCLR